MLKRWPDKGSLEDLSVKRDKIYHTRLKGSSFVFRWRGADQMDVFIAAVG
jgi:hypothetical protein